ncbi:MAG: AAA family ATPase [Synergistaceae bacterium]|nr:AAA family ATPase [Synergistaceae bacterium]
MIEELSISGVGGIREASLLFDGEFIVITGESGSGKSSLVRALEFISGKRAQLNYIHTQEESCEVQAVISSENIAGLEERYQPQEKSLIARRSFSRSGKGKCSLQGQSVPLALLSHAMEPNVVIQSQFAQLGLLEPARQLELVDSCGGEGLKKALSELDTAFAAAVAAEKRIIALKKRRKEAEERYEEAPAVIRQVKALELRAESEEQWNKELREIESGEASLRAMRLLAEKMNAPENGLLDQLERAGKSIYDSARGKDERWRAAVEKMLGGAQQLSSLLAAECRGSAEPEAAEEAKERLEKKIGALRRIKRTLNLPNAAAVLEYAAEAEKELEWLKNSREELERLESEAQELRRETAKLAMEVRAKRKESAAALAASVNGHLNELGMEYATFNIEIEPLDKVRATGAENVSFTLALPDQKPLPVGKNASGGELSRILIALQLSAGDDKLPGTLVFDEVEAGLGGKTALLAGCKLRQLSRRCRTVLITHQATIAAMADQHFVVKRDGENTEISEVAGKEREREIARMLSGDENSYEALEHAKALLENGGGEVR